MTKPWDSSKWGSFQAGGETTDTPTIPVTHIRAELERVSHLAKGHNFSGL